MPSRRIYALSVLAMLTCAAVFLFISTLRDQPHGTREPSYLRKTAEAVLSPALSTTQQPSVAIAPKLGNETIKAELGRASWKLFHTMMAQFPDTPKPDESKALKDYIYLFQRLYPCGECANHFGEILKKFPPQTSSRSAAAVWACHVHNEVNKSLKKEEFDCANIGEFYDCGCADDKKDSKDGKEGKATSEETKGKKIEKRWDLLEDMMLGGLP
ncbi:unnamed protein product [Zymoseptoria tritici ST99CH_1A5]|uniref:Sulfhydryl oxidase n=1 Tax=Zymoseptoria tritici ST99CH_1A5 TaxID=1276529 RepID=A0A1Y6LR09_ZYMTR|nr:unnamed protein product [Zymoseptoria tritici ST99CH_1A5]